MKIEKSHTSGDSLGPGGGITVANYVERARAFVALHGGAGFVIRALEGIDGAIATHTEATEPQWRAWAEYWQAKGIKLPYSLRRGLATVPCEWPEDFDAEARTSDRWARLPRRHPRDPEEHKRVVASFARLKAQMAKALAHMDVTALLDGRTNTPPFKAMTRQTASERLEDPEFRTRMSQPLPVSDAFKAHTKPSSEDIP